MADIVLANVLLIGGFVWSLLCYFAAASEPIPGRSGLGLVLYSGPVAFVVGLIWSVLILAGWQA